MTEYVINVMHVTIIQFSFKGSEIDEAMLETRYFGSSGRRTVEVKQYTLILN
jgi:hypothetical protein